MPDGDSAVPRGPLTASVAAGESGPVIVLSGEADQTTVPLLRETLATQLDTGARLVTVDASGLSFLDSASLRILILAARALKGRHGRLVLARPQPLVARLLEITGADRLLDVRVLAGLADSRLAQGLLPVSGLPAFARADIRRRPRFLSGIAGHPARSDAWR